MAKIKSPELLNLVKKLRIGHSLQITMELWHSFYKPLPRKVVSAWARDGGPLSNKRFSFNLDKVDKTYWIKRLVNKK